MLKLAKTKKKWHVLYTYHYDGIDYNTSADVDNKGLKALEGDKRVTIHRKIVIEEKR